jgi:hypothetical protein
VDRAESGIRLALERTQAKRNRLDFLHDDLESVQSNPASSIQS